MNVHASLIKHFKMNSYDEYDSFCEDLQFLRDCRVQCDYDPQHILLMAVLCDVSSSSSCSLIVAEIV